MNCKFNIIKYRPEDVIVYNISWFLQSNIKAVPLQISMWGTCFLRSLKPSVISDIVVESFFIIFNILDSSIVLEL